MTDILVTGARLPSGARVDLGIHDTQLVDPSSLTTPLIMDASSLIALPGLVDLHTHLREPSPHPAEMIATGTLAAARGGYTAVFAMPNTDPVTDTAERARHVLQLGESGAAEVIPVGAITRGLDGTHLSDIGALHDAGVTYFSDDGHCVMNAALMREALIRIGAYNGVVAQHCQDQSIAGATACLPDVAPYDWPAQALSDETLWPAVAEAVIVARDVQLALDTGTHVHICHVSTAESVEILRWARLHEAPVTSEVTPHHLLFGTDTLASGDTTFKVNPPLRGPEDALELRWALAEGVIDVVATDHAPHRPQDKAVPFAQAKPGMIGLENALGVIIETMVNPGLLDWEAVADRMSRTPARIGRVQERHGRGFGIGEPATFVLIDPQRRATVDKNSSNSLARNNPYHGMDLPDPVVATFWCGRQTYSH